MKLDELTHKLIAMSTDYRGDMEELGKLKAGRAVKWLEIRAISKTDKEADIRYSATGEGQREMVLSYKCKAVEREMSALKSHIRTLENLGA